MVSLNNQKSIILSLLLVFSFVFVGCPDREDYLIKNNNLYKKTYKLELSEPNISFKFSGWYGYRNGLVVSSISIEVVNNSGFDIIIDRSATRSKSIHYDYENVTKSILTVKSGKKGNFYHQLASQRQRWQAGSYIIPKTEVLEISFDGLELNGEPLDIETIMFVPMHYVR
jgi:hypothetical protein